MQHLRLANYKITKGTFPEIVDAAKGGMLGTFKAQPGFVRYGLADTGEGTCVSISLWETHSQAEQAAPGAGIRSPRYRSGRRLQDAWIGEPASSGRPRCSAEGPPHSCPGGSCFANTSVSVPKYTRPSATATFHGNTPGGSNDQRKPPVEA